MRHYGCGVVATCRLPSGILEAAQQRPDVISTNHQLSLLVEGTAVCSLDKQRGTTYNCNASLINHMSYVIFQMNT